MGARDKGEGGMNRGHTEGFQERETILYDTIVYLAIHFLKPTECPTPRMNLNVNMDFE